MKYDIFFFSSFYQLASMKNKGDGVSYYMVVKCSLDFFFLMILQSSPGLLPMPIPPAISIVK